ncbi:unnamed protein product, partial [Phaeothamnion confervicola]
SAAARLRPFSLGIRDSIMIAHSFSGKEFGPAQELHGATYTVDVEFEADDLAPKLNWVVDIGEASSILTEVLSKYNFKNLNELFPGENTTTEFMCRAIFKDIVAQCPHGFRGAICVKLWESHKAWACYRGEVQPPNNHE